MPRKSRKKTPETPTTEPTSIAAVLEQSPVATMIAEHEAKAPTLDGFLASREAKARIDPERQMPEPEEAVEAFKRQREREQAVTELPPPQTEVIPSRPVGPRGQSPEPVPTSFADAVKASRAAFAPVAEGFVNVDSFPAAGLKVNRSLDRKVAAVQFAEDRPLSRVSEYEKMREIQEAGFVYKTARRQWERYDPENLAGNLIDAKRIGAELAKEREGQAR